MDFGDIFPNFPLGGFMEDALYKRVSLLKKEADECTLEDCEACEEVILEVLGIYICLEEYRKTQLA